MGWLVLMFFQSSAALGQYGGSGIKGIVTISANCPIVSLDPEWQEICKDRPFETTLVVSLEGTEIGEFDSYNDGTFRVPLPPGHYTIASAGEDPYQRCDAKVDVEEGRYTEVTVLCSTGT